MKIPRIDRGGVDFSRLAGMVVDISAHGDKFMRILTIFGTLKDAYRVEDLEPYVGLVNVDPADYNKNVVSLREAAQLQARRTSSIEVVNAVCNCNGKCLDDGRCKCFKVGKKCTSHCHLTNKRQIPKKCVNC